MLAGKHGPGLSRIAGFGNEFLGLIIYDIPDLVGRLKGQRPWAFQFQDFKDNERGINCATKLNDSTCKNGNDTKEGCIKCCQVQ